FNGPAHVRFEAARSITEVALDAAGKPLSNAHVVAYYQQDEGQPRAAPQLFTSRPGRTDTDAQGRFTLSNLRPGSYNVFVSGDHKGVRLDAGREGVKLVGGL